MQQQEILLLKFPDFPELEKQSFINHSGLIKKDRPPQRGEAISSNIDGNVEITFQSIRIVGLYFRSVEFMSLSLAKNFQSSA